MAGRPAAERALIPLRRNRDFVLLQIGQALSTVGSEASGIAYTLLVLTRLQGCVNSVARAVALLALPLGPVVAGLLLAPYSVRTTAAFVLAGFVVIARSPPRRTARSALRRASTR